MCLIDVIQVNPLPGRQLGLTFEDGLQVVIDMNTIIQDYQGVFLPLLDDRYFQQVSVNPELGTIVWPNGADVCPRVLYSAATGKPLHVLNTASTE